jgi:hypothetical protein
MSNATKILIERRGLAEREKYVGIVTERGTDPSLQHRQRRYLPTTHTGNVAVKKLGFRTPMVSTFSPLTWLIDRHEGWVNRGYQIRSFVNGLLLAGHEVWMLDQRVRWGHPKPTVSYSQQYLTAGNAWPFVAIGFAYGRGEIPQLDTELALTAGHRRYDALEVIGELIWKDTTFFREHGVRLSIPIDMALQHLGR